MNHIALLSTLLTASLLAPPIARSAHAAATPAPSAAEDRFVIEAGEHDLRDLLDRSAEFLGRNYLYSEADLANTPDTKVRLQHELVLDAQSCEEVVSQLAYQLGFAMIPVDPEHGIYEWIFRAGPKRPELAARAIKLTPEQVLAQRKIVRPVLTSLSLHHVNAPRACNELRPFLLAGGQGGPTLGTVGDSLLIQGFTDQVASVIELVREIDTAPGAKPSEQQEQSWRDGIEARIRALEAKVAGKPARAL
jgi:hypothetical protein